MCGDSHSWVQSLPARSAAVHWSCGLSLLPLWEFKGTETVGVEVSACAWAGGASSRQDVDS